MTRDVVCNVTNKTGYTFYKTGLDLSHGEYSSGGQSPIPITPNCSSLKIFHFHKTTLSIYGVTGSVTYRLQDGTLMQMSFNCPFHQDGTSGTSNCWFYVGFSGELPVGGTAFYTECEVTIDGQPMDPNTPVNGSHIVANITIFIKTN